VADLTTKLAEREKELLKVRELLKNAQKAAKDESAKATVKTPPKPSKPTAVTLGGGADSAAEAWAEVEKLRSENARLKSEMDSWRKMARETLSAHNKLKRKHQVRPKAASPRCPAI
jgi:hypothetical protein